MLTDVSSKNVSEAYLAEGKQCFHDGRVSNVGFQRAMTLGKRLKAAREGSHLTQDAVAAHLGITRPAVTQWESDTTTPELGNLIKLAELYGIPVSAIIDPNTHDRQGRVARIAELAAELSEKDQEWYIKCLERDLEKNRGGV